MKKFAIFISGNGGFSKAVYKNANLIENGQLSLIISDRICNGYEFFKNKTTIQTELFEFDKYATKEDFEKSILKKLLECEINYIFLTYDRILGKILLESEYKNKIFNLHPALLPMFKGVGAIDKAFESTALFYGSTVHLVDKTVDGGPILSQTIISKNLKDSKEIFINKLFQKSSTLLIDTIYKVINDEFIMSNERIFFKNALYGNNEFNPKLSINKNLVSFDFL